MLARFLGGLVVSVAVAACSSSPAAVPRDSTAASTSPAPAPREAAVSAGATSSGMARPADARATGKPRVVILGDSLTAGLGVQPDEAYPAVVQRHIADAGLAVEVVNAGVSGDTSAGGLRRLDWSLDGDVRVLVVALGGNDGLRGLPVDELRANLSTIITRARERGITVLLCGMEAPPNFGADYTAAFRQVYGELAKTPGVSFLPFLLDGVAGNARLNQADGIHPNPEGARKVADLVWAALRPLLATSLS